ncbi:MAG: hypothetical protein D6754_00800, partial [Alphaproteobacteria bacterium]
MKHVARPDEPAGVEAGAEAGRLRPSRRAVLAAGAGGAAALAVPVLPAAAALPAGPVSVTHAVPAGPVRLSFVVPAG